MQATTESVRRSEVLVEREYDHETRRYNDVTTWLAEVLDGNMRTPFVYRYQDGELYSDCGSPMGPIFDKSIEQSKDLPAYELRRRKIEKAEYEDMIHMAEGKAPNTMIVLSDFPPELMGAKADVGGYNVARKQTMMRVITRRPDGTMGMVSQSLDGSYRWSLEEVCRAVGYEPVAGELLGQRIQLDLDMVEQELLIDRLTGVYDRAVGVVLGGDWYAGVRGGGRGNTYDFVCGQNDLITAYLARSGRFTGGQMDYGLAAAMKARFERNEDVAIKESVYGGVVSFTMAIHEMEFAAKQAITRGEVFSGCGASLGASIGAQDQYTALGLGNKTQEAVSTDKFGPLKFKCKNGHWNQRPRNKLIKNCKIHSCRNSVAC